LLKHTGQLGVFPSEVRCSLFFTTDCRANTFAHLLVGNDDRCFGGGLDVREQTRVNSRSNHGRQIEYSQGEEDGEGF
jgi:hypothetical protein